MKLFRTMFVTQCINNVMDGFGGIVYCKYG